MNITNESIGEYVSYEILSNENKIELFTTHALFQANEHFETMIKNALSFSKGDISHANRMKKRYKELQKKILLHNKKIIEL